MEYEDFVQERFAAKKWRVTAGVRNVCRVLESFECFLSAEEIHQHLADWDRPIDTVTVYRILHKLQAVELVYEFDTKWRRSTDPDNELESHFLICTESGYAEEIFLDYFDSISKQLSKEKGFELNEVKMAFYGVSNPDKRPIDKL